MARDCLAFKMHIQRRGVQLDTRCPVCHRLDEDGGHCFLKCKLVKRCWSTLSLEPVRQQLLSKQSAWEVVTEILSLKEEVRTKTVLFLWKWWTERNKINKGEKGQGVDGVAADVLNLLNDLSKLERKEPIRQTAGNARWKAPPPGQLMINSVQGMMQGSWGFTIRDYEGEVVLAGPVAWDQSQMRSQLKQQRVLGLCKRLQIMVFHECRWRWTRQFFKKLLSHHPWISHSRSMRNVDKGHS